MSFLLRRNLLALEGFDDSFDRAIENPVKQPWVHLGDGTPADINTSAELHIPSNSSSTNAGGPSFEFQPFTPNFSIEFEIWNPVTGLVQQGFAIYMTNSWAQIGAAFLNVVGIRLFHAPAAGGEQIQIVEYANPWTIDTARYSWVSPVTWNGTTLVIQILVDDDSYVRIYQNGTFIGAGMISPAYKLGPGRRCMRFFNNCLNDVWMRSVLIKDRPGSFPDGSTFTDVVVTDNFNRADSATVGNGWTKLGTNAGISTNSFSTTGSSDGSRAIIRDTGISNGRQRIEAVIGGPNGPNATADSSLILCCNAAGTQALVANIFSADAYISRVSTSLSGSAPTMTDYAHQTGLTFTAGDALAFNIYDGNAWLEQNGNRILFAAGVNDVVPATNQYAGLRVERTSFNNSLSWDSATIKHS